ncbi:MAG TPA: LPS assembly protein LptD, partial [Thermoanaerobaculia bacterium]
KRLLVLTALALTATHLFAQPIDPEQFRKPKSSKFSFEFKAQEGGAIHIKADHQEAVQDEYYILHGNVKVTYGDITISGDKITYNLKTKDVTGEGNVILDQGPRRLSAERVIFNLDSETGTLFKATGYFEPSVYFTGEKIEKIGEGTYRLTNGIFTSCDLDDPSWSFRVQRGTVTVDDYARLQNISFRARRLPLFWTPYVVWPTKRDRSRGLLVPKVGFSERFGTYLGNAYFIPFGPSYDATIFADYYSKGYYGTGAEVRYKPSVDVAGKFLGHLVRDPEPELSAPDEEGDETLEWKYAYTHTHENLPGGFRGVIDIRDFSDLEFFQRFERRFELNTISNIYSSAYLTKNRSRYSLNVRADRRKHFLGQGQEQIFQQLPAVQLTTYPNRIGNTPFYLALESSISNLLTTSTSPVRPAASTHYQRADFFPTLSVQLRTPLWISIKPQLSIRETYYSSSLEPTTRAILDESLSRSYAQGQVEIVGPSLSRIYQREAGGFSRFKHVIEPRVRYVYTTEVDNQNRVIQFDTVDSPVLPIVRDSVEYSLTQRIIGKEKGENASAREIMSITLRQSAALSDPFRQVVIPGRKQNRFTPLSLTTRFNPYQSVSVDATAVFGNLSQQLDQASLSANLRSAATNRYLGLTWYSTFKPPGAVAGGSSQFRFLGGIPIWKEKLRADAAVNYDAERRDLLEQRYLVGYNASCYNVGVEFRDFIAYSFLGPTDRNREYQISVSLKNVGTFVDLRGSLDALFQR